VKRNRIKRRLRAVVQQVFPHEVRPGYAYVLIGRWQTPDLPFDDLLTQASRALSKIPAAASESSESSHK
jgi:ribonuclease P protein component